MEYCCKVACPPTFKFIFQGIAANLQIKQLHMQGRKRVIQDGCGIAGSRRTREQTPNELPDPHRGIFGQLGFHCKNKKLDISWQKIWWKAWGIHYKYIVYHATSSGWGKITEVMEFNPKVEDMNEHGEFHPTGYVLSSSSKYANRNKLFLVGLSSRDIKLWSVTNCRAEESGQPQSAVTSADVEFLE